MANWLVRLIGAEGLELRAYYVKRIGEKGIEITANMDDATRFEALADAVAVCTKAAPLFEGYQRQILQEG